MPPVVRRKNLKAARSAYRRKHGLPALSNYKRGTNRGKTSTRRSNANTIALSTLSRKSENLSISYRELVEFNDMGGDNGSTPALIRVNLNNPLIGGATPDLSAGQSIVTVIANQKTGSTDPTALHHSYNNKRNLVDRLQDYLNTYRTVVVTSAEVHVVISPKLNQLNGMTDGYRSIIPYIGNRDVTNPAPGTPTTYLYSYQANAMSEVECWCVRQQNQGQLTSLQYGTPPLETLKQGIPGMKMTRLNLVPNSKKGCTFRMKYTPKSQYGISDWKDNKTLLKIISSATGNQSQKEAFCYVGIGGRFKGLDPKASGSEIGLPHFNVEVKVKYNINFSERLNVDGNNEPNPHDEL